MYIFPKKYFFNYSQEILHMIKNLSTVMTSVTDTKLALKQAFDCDFWDSPNGDTDGGKKSWAQPNRTLAGFRQGAAGKASIQFVTIPYDQQTSETRIGHHHCDRSLIPFVTVSSVRSSHHNAK